MKAALILCSALATGAVHDSPVDDQVADLAAAIEADLGVPARVERAHEQFTALRIGSMRGPSIAVVLSHEHDSLDAMRTIAVECGQRARLEDRSILLIAGGPRSESVPVEVTVAARNFPGDWPAARDTYGPEAGPYPASDPWVRGVVDTLIADQDCAAIIDARERPDLVPGPGSLRLYAESCLYLPYTPLASATEPMPRVLHELISEHLVRVPKLALDEARWKRVAAGTWALDLQLSNDGEVATGHRGDPSFRRERGCHLGVEVRGGDYSWSACAIAPFGPGTLRSVEIVRSQGGSGGSARLPDLSGGEIHRVRLLMVAGADAPEGVPEVSLVATGARAVRTPRRSFQPAQKR